MSRGGGVRRSSHTPPLCSVRWRPARAARRRPRLPRTAPHEATGSWWPASARRGWRLSTRCKRRWRRSVSSRVRWRSSSPPYGHSSARTSSNLAAAPPSTPFCTRPTAAITLPHGPHPAQWSVRVPRRAMPSRRRGRTERMARARSARRAPQCGHPKAPRPLATTTSPPFDPYSHPSRMTRWPHRRARASSRPLRQLRLQARPNRPVLRRPRRPRRIHRCRGVFLRLRSTLRGYVDHRRTHGKARP